MPACSDGVPAAVAEARERAALLDDELAGDLAHPALGVGGHLLGVERQRLRAQVVDRLAHERRVQRAVVARRGADRAAPAVLRVGVVELLLQRAHEAAPVGAEARHRRLLAAAQRGDRRVAVGVVVPGAVGLAHPAAAVAAHGALDVEHLEHRVDAPAPEVDHRGELGRRGAVGADGVEVLEHAVDVLAARERLLDEEVLDAAVLGAAQQDDVGALDRAAGTADLLVVGDDRAGRLVVHDEAEVGLVVAHAERARGDDALEVVGEQPVLDGDPPLGLDLAGVGLGGDAVGVQPGGDLLGVALGERVDDARAREVVEVRREPREAVGLAGQLDDLEAQARAAERPAVGDELRRPRGPCAAAPRRRRRRGRSPSPSCRGRRRRRAGARARRRCGGSRGGSRGPSR